MFDIFLIFAQNIDCGYMLELAVLTSTHNLCFGTKIRKIGIPLHTPVLLYKSGVYGGIQCTLHGNVILMFNTGVDVESLRVCLYTLSLPL